MSPAGQSQHYGSNVSDWCSYNRCIRYPPASRSVPKKESPSSWVHSFGCGMLLTWNIGTFNEFINSAFCSHSSLPHLVIHASCKRSTARSWFCIAFCCRALIWHLHLVSSGIKDILYTFIARCGRKRRSIPANVFQTANGVLASWFQKFHRAR